MAMVIKNNLAAMETLNILNQNNSKLGKALAKVSSGQKINSAGDDASGLAISERMRVQLRALDQDQQNVQNGASMLRIAEGGVQNIVDTIRSMKELAIDAANDSNTDEDRRVIQKELNQRIATINDVALGTQFNGKRLIDGTYAQKLVTETKTTGWKEPPKTFTMVPGKTYIKTVNADGSRTIVGENDVKNMTRSFTGVNSSITSPTSLKAGGSSSFTADIGFIGTNSTWNWASAYQDKKFSGQQTSTVYFEDTQTNPSTPQQVMKAFMKSLDEATTSGSDVLDEAINYATGGTITDKAELVSNFMRDLNAASSYTDFLSDKCGIILGNADTGAITGSDAGGSTTKTAESVVPETVAVTSWGLPTTGSSTTIEGLTVNWPTAGVSGRGFTDAEKHILKGLNSDWIQKSLALVQESYGLDFTYSDASVKTINVKFEEKNDNTLAYVSHSYNTSTGKASSLNLVVNMKYYKDIDPNSEDGALNTSSSMYHQAGYLDRTIAHEFTHAVMAANINYFSSLPMYIKEGAAELVHGIDDERQTNIVNLLNTTSGKTKLQTIFNSGGTQGDSDPYAAGYVLLRYLAKQGAGNTISKSDTVYNDSYTSSVPKSKETGVAINFAGSESADGSALTFPDSFDEQGITILCGGCEQYINIVFDKDMTIGQGTLTSTPLSDTSTRMRRDYRVGIGGATSTDDLAKAIFEGLKNTSGRSTSKDITVKHSDDSTEVVCLGIDETHNVRIAKNPDYPSGSGSEYVFVKEKDLAMLFIDSGTIEATGGAGSKDNAPEGTVQQMLDNSGNKILDENGNQIPYIQTIKVTEETTVNLWDPIIETVTERVGTPLVVHSGTQAGQSTNHYINNMQTSALTAGQIFDDNGNLINSNDRERYNALSHDSTKQAEWLRTLNTVENMTIDDISVTTVENANLAIRVLDGALEYSLDTATTLGAYLQRLESTENNIVTTIENTTASESVIRDADMAKEMTNYTKANVLLQAAQSMLSQANQNPANVLSLLR